MIFLCAFVKQVSLSFVGYQGYVYKNAFAKRTVILIKAALM